MNNFITCLNNARTSAQSQSCFNQVVPYFDQAFAAAGALCTCLGPSASSELTAQEKADLREAFTALRQAGFNLSNYPACFN